MFRYLLATFILAATLSFSGCVMGPCGGGHCNDCDGASASACGNRVLGNGRPGAAFRNWRKGLTCGSGCGEVYYDEWSSTPPDCVDPCPDFAGGGCGTGVACGCGVRSCRGGCGFRPLRAVKRIVVGLYGKRFCGDCGHGVDSCSCDDPYSGYSGGACCDGCASSGGGGGCSTGNCSVAPMATTQIASNVPMSNRQSSTARQQMLTRQAMSRTTANSRSASTTVRKPASSQKFYRQANQQPQNNRALRR